MFGDVVVVVAVVVVVDDGCACVTCSVLIALVGVVDVGAGVACG